MFFLWVLLIEFYLHFLFSVLDAIFVRIEQDMRLGFFSQTFTHYVRAFRVLTIRGHVSLSKFELTHRLFLGLFISHLKLEFWFWGPHWCTSIKSLGYDPTNVNFPQQGLSKLHNVNTIFKLKFHNLTFLDNHVHCSRGILSQAQKCIENTQCSIKQTKTTRRGILVCCLFLQQKFKFPSFHPHDSKILQVFVFWNFAMTSWQSSRVTLYLWYLKGKGGCDTMVIAHVVTTLAWHKYESLCL